MTVREYARGAWQEIRSHKVRSAMTCLSLAVGVAALLFTFSQTGGTMKRYRDAKQLAGPGRLRVEYKQSYVSKHISKGLTTDDADAIRAEWPELYMVSPHVSNWNVKFRLDGFKSRKMRVLGTNDEWRKRDWVYTLRGRFLSARDLERRERVCVIVQGGGWKKKPWWARYFHDDKFREYLERHEVLGHQAVINDHLFTIVGIVREPYKDLDPRWFREGGGDGTVIVPSTSYSDYLAQRGRLPEAVDSLELDTGDETTASVYLRKVEGLLESRHRERDFEVKDFRMIMAGALEEIKRFIISILVIGIVAVLASGIGIMNVTLATIFSRVREIGIRRALGATRADIVWQFVAEACALGVVGGVTGVLLGSGLVVYLAPRAERMAAIGPLYVLGALAIALATGFLFSLYPAYKASRFDPVEALRYE